MNDKPMMNAAAKKALLNPEHGSYGKYLDDLRSIEIREYPETITDAEAVAALKRISRGLRLRIPDLDFPALDADVAIVRAALARDRGGPMNDPSEGAKIMLKAEEMLAEIGVCDEALPGSWKCPRCEFVEFRRVFSAATGDVSIDTKTDRRVCPNDGADMMPIMRSDIIRADRRAVIEEAKRRVNKRWHETMEEETFFQVADVFRILNTMLMNEA